MQPKKLELIDKNIFEKAVKKYRQTFETYGFPISELKTRFEESTNQKNYANTSDLVWSLFQELLLKAGQQSKTEYELYEGQWKIYAAMLDFRRKTEKSKANEILQLHLKAYVQMSSAQSTLNLKCEIISGACCEYCNSLNGEKFEINEVLDKQFLGSKNCTNERGCNCCYSLVPERDSNGKLILNSK